MNEASKGSVVEGEPGGKNKLAGPDIARGYTPSQSHNLDDDLQFKEPLFDKNFSVDTMMANRPKTK